MRLVIDLPEEIRLALINNIQLSIDQQSICDSCIKQAIINGTSLPKGHGDLIDRDFVRDVFIDAEMRKDYEYLGLDDAPTIIEADKEESEE